MGELTEQIAAGGPGVLSLADMSPQQQAFIRAATRWPCKHPTLRETPRATAGPVRRRGVHMKKSSFHRSMAGTFADKCRGYGLSAPIPTWQCPHFCCPSTRDRS